VKLKAEIDGDRCHLTVQDTGRGIPSDKLQSIFERFQQVDASDSRSKGGTGLGLAICRHIVERHNGKIWVESVLGKGSIFHIELPLIAEQ
jgi:signal transduction histidine kinase